MTRRYDAAARMYRTRRRTPLSERIERNSIPEPNSGCHLWTGQLNVSGYGIIGLRLGKGYNGYTYSGAHREAYKLANGDIPLGLCVCHSCDTPSCVNPDHLFLGTNADNVADKVRKGRAQGLVGLANHKAKLTPEAVASIRASDAGHTDLARQFGVTRAAIMAVRNGRNWGHL